MIHPPHVHSLHVLRLGLPPSSGVIMPSSVPAELIGRIRLSIAGIFGGVSAVVGSLGDFGNRC